MLKGISPLMSPDLLKTLAEMGHGDEIVIGDSNFPAASTNSRCLRLDGHGANELMDAILQLMPLDSYADTNVFLMAPGALEEGDPPIWKAFEKTIEAQGGGGKITTIDRFAFYQRARQAYATVQSGERALYACVILKKGVL